LGAGARPEPVACHATEQEDLGLTIWKRFKRMVKSNVGRIVPPMDASTRRVMRGLDDPIADLSGDLTELKAQTTLLEKKLRKLRRREEELEAQVSAAEKHDAGELARRHQGTLQDVRQERSRMEVKLEAARHALERVTALREAQEQARREAARDSLARFEAEQSASSKGQAAGGSDVEISVRPRGKTIGPEKAAGVQPDGAMTPGEAARSRQPIRKTLGSDSTEDALGDLRAAATTQEAPATPQAEEVQPDQPGVDLVGELERLGKLLEAGALTAEEFAQAKRKLLEG
jgi:Short C-terminal domain